MSDLAPAAGGEGSGEGEGEGGSFGDDVTLLRVDQDPFRTQPEQQFNLTENAGDEFGGGDEGEGIGGGDDGGTGDAGGDGTEIAGAVEDEESGSGEGDAPADPAPGTNFSDS